MYSDPTREGMTGETRSPETQQESAATPVCHARGPAVVAPTPEQLPEVLVGEEVCAFLRIPHSEEHLASLRKNCCTNWLSDGVPPHEAQEWMGHESLEKTMKYYSRVTEGAKSRAKESSERILAGLVA